MGARQSKRSVDITTGKEVVVEGSEIAGAGGEGKLERIEDLDNLKPQQNGDAAHEDVEISDKEKKMQDDEIIENVKDTCNEKEIILSPVNGDNGETPKEVVENNEAETNKKNKKEKTKRKWSFRSISFSKKDKQKPAKKEETTNGECAKVPEEAVADNDAAATTEQPEAKAETEAVVDTNKVEEKAAEKAPETPVTEPLTNGSSAPESPKEEIRQNGDAASVDEQSPIVEKKEEPEPVKPAEVPVEVPAVESLPVNGLKIEDVVEESKPEIKMDIPEKAIPEPVEVKATEIVNVEVCEKENCKVENVEVAPPPLPSNPPPSSLTMFAESTMAPLVVDNPVVGEESNVDQETSIPPALSQVPDTDVSPANEILPEPEIVVVNETPNENIPVEESPNALQSDATDVPQETITPPESAIVENVEKESVVENLAVVSPNEPEPEIPKIPENIPEVPILEKNESSPDVIVETVISSVETPIVNESDNVSLSEKSEVSENKLITESDVPLEIPVDNVISSTVEAENINTVEPLNSIENMQENLSESPLPQRTPSDPDMSASGEPQSDSFPPPPPPVSCPESMTELSVSESLPPPMSESSQPDTVLNSPTSEALDFPPKDLPSPIKDNDNSIEPEALVLTNGEAHGTKTDIPNEEQTVVAELPKEIKSVEESKMPADFTQVKTTIDTDIINTDSPSIPDSISGETAVATE